MIYIARNWEIQHSKTSFEKIARDRREMLQRAINNNIEVLYSVGALFNSSQTVNRNEFRIFARDPLARHPEICSVRWQPLVTGPNREAFEKANRKEGLAHFAINQVNRLGQLEPAPSEKIYFPVQFIEPQRDSWRWLGLDDPIAMLTRNEAGAIKPPPALLVSAYEHPLFESAQDLMTLYLPVFTHNLQSVDKEMAGFAVLVLDLHKMIVQSLANFPLPQIAVTTANRTELRPHIQIIDSEAVGANRFVERVWLENNAGKLEWQSVLDIASFKVPIIFTSRVTYFQTSKPWLLWFVVGTGLLYFALSGCYLWISEKNRWKIGQLVQKLTAESSARAAAAAQLSANEIRLQELNADLEARIEERTAKLQELNQNLESFVYSVSHDLKAPLRGIEGYGRLLLEDYRAQLPEEACGFLDNIRTATTRMSQLIDDLLAYSRLERQPLTILSFPIRPVIDRILAERELEIQAMAAEIQVEVDDIHVKADPHALLLALRNLIDNALKFSNNAKPPVITISAGIRNDKVQIAVADNGCGFDMKYHDRIFEIFQRLHRIEDYNGTGIGLTIVRKGVERMHGRVWAESISGQGATFYIELPL